MINHAAGSAARAPPLPARAGLGLKSAHYQAILDSSADVGFFEVHAENYMVAGGPFHHYLGLLRERYALSLHGVGLSIGAAAPLDEAHLQRLAVLIERYQPQAFSEHLAWSSHAGTLASTWGMSAWMASACARMRPAPSTTTGSPVAFPWSTSA